MKLNEGDGIRSIPSPVRLYIFIKTTSVLNKNIIEMKYKIKNIYNKNTKHIKNEKISINFTKYIDL